MIYSFSALSSDNVFPTNKKKRCSCLCLCLFELLMMHFVQCSITRRGMYTAHVCSLWLLWEQNSNKHPEPLGRAHRCSEACASPLRSQYNHQAFFGCSPHTRRCYHVSISAATSDCSWWCSNPKYVVEKQSSFLLFLHANTPVWPKSHLKSLRVI